MSIDTVFSTVTDFDGYNCAQVFFGLISICLNPYLMPSHKKGNIIKAYQDFMRYEGVPQCLHQGLAPEQKTDEIISINRDMRVKDSWSETAHPNQNQVEQGGIRILKQGADGLLKRTGAPPES